MVDFSYIGPSRAGSTWLWRNLQNHPGVYMPPYKPVHYWDEYLTGGHVYGKMYEQRSIEWYCKQFSVKDKVTGDITESYAPMEEWRIKEFAKHYPKCKILYSLRNPMDIAWSAAQMIIPRTLGPIEKADINSIVEYLRGDWDMCSTSRYEDRNCDLAENIRKWQRHFGDNVMTYWFEDINSQPKQLMKNISKHIGVNPNYWDSISESQLKRVENQGQRLKPRSDVKEWIWHLHEPKVTDLEQMYNVDLSKWREKWRP